MTNAHKRAFLAGIQICSHRHVLGDIAVLASDVKPSLAKRLVSKKAQSMRRSDRFVAVTPLEGLYYRNKTYFSNTPSSSEEAVTRVHENFHERADKHGLDTKGDSSIAEESAAYAWQCFGRYMNQADELEAAKQAKRYRYFAIRSVRFLHALTLPEPNGMLRQSLDDMMRNAWYIRGDPIAVAFSYAKDLALYMECVHILKAWGPKKGKDILMEGLEIAEKNGLNAARDFLICHLAGNDREDLEEEYGIKDRMIMLPKIYSSTVKDDTLVLKNRHDGYVFEEF